MESENPYANPTTHARDMELKVPGRYTPIFIGVTVGLGVFYVVSAIWSTIHLSILTWSGIPSKDFYKYVYQSTGVQLFKHTAAIFSEATGGYWCVKLSRTSPLINVALAAAISCAVTMIQLFSPYVQLIPPWSRAMSLLTSIIGFIVGARYALRKSK